jgi:hypothetical protein
MVIWAKLSSRDALYKHKSPERKWIMTLSIKLVEIWSAISLPNYMHHLKHQANICLTLSCTPEISPTTWRNLLVFGNFWGLMSWGNGQGDRASILRLQGDKSTISSSTIPWLDFDFFGVWVFGNHGIKLNHYYLNTIKTDLILSIIFSFMDKISSLCTIDLNHMGRKILDIRDWMIPQIDDLSNSVYCYFVPYKVISHVSSELL